MTDEFYNGDEENDAYEVEAANEEATKENEPLSIVIPPRYFEDCFQLVARNALTNQFEKKMSDVLTKKIDALLAQMTTDYIAKMVEDRLSAFFDKRFPKTNSWGEAKGTETVSLREHLEEKFNAYMTQNVNSDGRVESHGTQMKRSDWFIKKFGIDKLSDVAAGEIKKVRQEAEKQVSAAVGQFIAQNLVAPMTASMITKN